MFFLLCCCSVALYFMDFSPILENFSCMVSASFDFDDFIFGTGDADPVQFGVGTSTAIGAIKTTGTISGAPPYPSSSRPSLLSQGDLISIVHSLEIHA